MSINKVIILGNISTDIELKQTQSGLSVCSFNVAVNRFSKDTNEKKADFFPVVAWREKAEFVSRNFSKGQAIAVVGRLENREWTDKQNNKRISTEIIADEISFAGGKEIASTRVETPPTQSPPSFMPSAYTSQPQFESVSDGDGQLPF
jgi:single-strand DNA-binding protein